MTDYEIVGMMLNENNDKHRMELAELIGYEKIKKAQAEAWSLGRKCPEIMYHILGELLKKEEEKFAKLLEQSNPEQVELLVKVWRIVRPDSEILRMILEQNSLEAQLTLAEFVGFDRLRAIVMEMRYAGKDVPSVMDEILARISSSDKDARFGRLLRESNPEQLELLIQAFGSKTCENVTNLNKISGRKLKELQDVEDCVTKAKRQESEEFIAKIEKLSVTDYELAKKLIIVYGFEKTEKDIEFIEHFRPVKSVVKEIIELLRANEKGESSQQKGAN